MKYGKQAYILVLLMLLSGCAPMIVGPAPKGTPHSHENIIGSNKVRIIFTRGATTYPHNHWQQNIHVNGQLIGTLKADSSSTYTDINPGSISVSVTAPPEPGRSIARINTVAGDVFNITVSERPYMGTAIAFGAIGTALSNASDSQEGGPFRFGSIIKIHEGNPKRHVGPEHTGDARPSENLSSNTDTKSQKLRALHTLYNDGVITKSDFEKQKEKLLTEF